MPREAGLIPRLLSSTVDARLSLTYDLDDYALRKGAYVILPKSWLRRLWVGLALALVLGLVASAAACEEGGEEGDIEDTIRAAIDAWNAQDVEGFLAAVTDKGLQETFGATREEAEQFLPEFFETTPATVRRVSNVEVSGNTATAEVEYAFGIVVDLERDSFIKEGNVWKLDGSQDLIPEIPSDVTPIDLGMSEFAFSLDPSAITSENPIAFRATNGGQQEHELQFVRVPADFDLQAALRSEEEPPGIENIGFLEPVEPGEETNMVFTQPLEPGRYVGVCFVEDPQTGQEHALLGMFFDFTVPGEAAEETPTEEAAE